MILAQSTCWGPAFGLRRVKTHYGIVMRQLIHVAGIASVDHFLQRVSQPLNDLRVLVG